MKFTKQTKGLAYGIGLALVAGQAAAHGLDDVGAPACLEANFMMADAMNNNPGATPPVPPFAEANGPGQVLEVNIVTGERGITVANPFGPASAPGNGPVCDNGSGNISCAGNGFGTPAFKPTGVLSGGLNGHAFISSAAQQALTEFHRDGTPIRSVSYRPLLGNPTGNAGLGSLPRPLGTQMMPNGNIVQAICDANFFNAQNSDREAGYTDPTGTDPGNISYQYFPPVYQTAERSANSRILVIDQESLEVIDEYSQPKNKDARWTCMAGLAFTDEGMGVSMFHGAAIAMVDWKAGIDKHSRGVGSNEPFDDDDDGHDYDGHKHDDDDDDNGFELGKKKNRSKVTRWIDMRPGKPADDPSRRDSLRAWGLDEDGTIYVTDRERAKDCLQGEGAADGCNPTTFRQKVQVVDLGEDSPSRTIGLDPGVNVIAGIRPNRMSATACDNIGGPTAGGTNPAGTSCDVETILIAASAYNPIANGGGFMRPGGGVGEYSILPADADGNPDADGIPTTACTGEHGIPANNTGCAQPIASFLGTNPSVGPAYKVDPRMLMVIHEAFVQ